MTANARLRNIPDQLRPLGTLRRLFEPHLASMAMCTVRGAFPMLIGTGLFLTAVRWFPDGGWKFYLICAAAVGMFLNGVRVIAIAWSRGRQKLATFEHGFALWRQDSLQIYRWSQVEDIEVSPEFFGFRVWCRKDDGQLRKINFDTSSDPTDQLRLVWRDLEEQTWLHRLPLIGADLADGKPVVFVRKTWGKETGTKIALSKTGIAVTPRYKPRKYLDWLEVDTLRLDDEHIVVRQTGHQEPWLREFILAIPGCAAIVQAGQTAQSEFANLARKLAEERCGSLLADLSKGKNAQFGSMTLSSDGMRDHDAQIDWSAIESVRLDEGSLEVFTSEGDASFDAQLLSFSERVLLRIFPAQVRAHHSH